MTIEQFLSITEERIPTVDEMISLCESLGIGFNRSAEGRPVLKVNDSNRAEAERLVRLFGREPFRSAVISRKLGGSPITDIETALWNAGATVAYNQSLKAPVLRGSISQAVMEAMKTPAIREEIVHRLRGLCSAKLEGLLCIACNPGILPKDFVQEHQPLRGCPKHGAASHWYAPHHPEHPSRRVAS